MTTTRQRAKRKRPACTCGACKHARAARIAAKKDAAIASLRVLVAAVDGLKNEGFDSAGIRARYSEVLAAGDRAAATLEYLDASEREEGRAVAGG